ncbi:MAG TPA: rRNA (cytidine-2'-O-)-methyltransferase, partial [Xanthomonadales bacterium]|nr:rRNA (cytidine-2'-O-)-methyltransferase [Xanthomonadales bacterium]
LEGLRDDERTLVFYEAKHRIEETLADLVEAFGADRRAALARELTKIHETVLDGTLAAIAATVAGDAEQRLGEFVLVVAGAEGADEGARRQRDGERVFALLAKELPAGKAAKLAAAITGAKRNALYRTGSED